MPKRIPLCLTLNSAEYKYKSHEISLTAYSLAGGVKKIPGIYYAEGSETAKRSRQLVWRAAVDMCKTTSQLALQVIEIY